MFLLPFNCQRKLFEQNLSFQRGVTPHRWELWNRTVGVQHRPAPCVPPTGCDITAPGVWNATRRAQPHSSRSLPTKGNPAAQQGEASCSPSDPLRGAAARGRQWQGEGQKFLCSEGSHWLMNWLDNGSGQMCVAGRESLLEGPLFPPQSHPCEEGTSPHCLSFSWFQQEVTDTRSQPPSCRRSHHLSSLSSCRVSNL